MSSPSTPLPTRTIGGSGSSAVLEISLVGLGCNNFGRRLDLEGTRAVLDAALEAGITFFDTADIYGEGGGSELLMGEALEGRRDRFVLTTKFGMETSGIDGVPDIPRGSPEYVRWAVEGSMRRLRTDYFDLYQYHQPDGVTPIEETLGVVEHKHEPPVGEMPDDGFEGRPLRESQRVGHAGEPPVGVTDGADPHPANALLAIRIRHRRCGEPSLADPPGTGDSHDARPAVEESTQCGDVRLPPEDRIRPGGQLGGVTARRVGVTQQP